MASREDDHAELGLFWNKKADSVQDVRADLIKVGESLNKALEALALEQTKQNEIVASLNQAGTKLNALETQHKEVIKLQALTGPKIEALIVQEKELIDYADRIQAISITFHEFLDILDAKVQKLTAQVASMQPKHA